MASSVSLYARRKIYHEFESHFGLPNRVLDIGVTSESVAPEANFFEEFFPYKDRITAVGIEDGAFLTQKYPGLKFIQVKAGAPYPFPDSKFDVAFSNAVIEHITDRNSRLTFIHEILRVSKAIFLTTPNKYFPLEVHTGVPLLHFLLPRLFFALLDRGVISRFYSSKNLNLLSHSDLTELAKTLHYPFEIKKIKVFGFVSNWILIIKKDLAVKPYVVDDAKLPLSDDP